MNIVFLDIDGVLNSLAYYKEKRQVERNAEVGYPLGDISVEAVELLNYLYDQVEYKVVISSTWRSKGIDRLKEILVDYAGLKAEIIDLTPRLLTEECDSKSYTLRGNEIYAWLKENEDVYGCDYNEYSSYVILDDDSDMLYWQKDNFICVDGNVGITGKTVFKMERFFKYNISLQ
jgi:hypothetical protein